jgi:hypothetical protein
VRDVLNQQRAIREEVRRRGAVDVAVELARHLDALAAYVGNRQAKKEVQIEQRRAEMLIGELLGPAEPVAGPGRGKPSLASDGLSPNERMQFRLMYQFAALVESIVESTPQRRRVLRAIENARRARSEAGEVAADLRVGDFREVLADLRDVDAVVTDPPYGREWIPLYADLAQWALEVLRPDGVLVVMVGQYWLREVVAALGDHLPYRWTLAYLTPHFATSIYAAHLATHWKPVLLYGGRGQYLGTDVVRSSETDKTWHIWGQSVSGFERLLELTTEPGHHVVDPFLGAGTTAVAAKNTARRCSGCDIDGAAVMTARQRLG